MVTYSDIAKPSTPTFGEIDQPALFGFLLMENGVTYATEASGYYIINDDDYSDLSKPSAPVYLNISKP